MALETKPFDIAEHLNSPEAIRASLYKSLSDGGNTRFSTICKVTKALGCKLAVA